MWLALCIASAQDAPAPTDRFYDDRDDVRRQLEALGYVGAYEPNEGSSGVVVNRPDARPGWILLSSGHEPEARIIDRRGRIRHRWHRSFPELFPDGGAYVDHVGASSWRSVELLDDGDLVVVHEGLGLARLGPDGRVRWRHLDGAHHDVDPAPDGTLWTLTRRVSTSGGTPVLEDRLTHRSADGAELASHSVLGALRSSRWASWIDPDVEGIEGDWLHTNSLDLLVRDGPHPAFRSGRLLLSMRHLNALVVFDPSQERIVWASRGPWARQHDAQVGPSGRLWLFDNRGVGDEASRALALDPSDPTRIVRRWGDELDPPLHSHILGAVQELPGGHVLVTESTAGRCVEIDGSGQVVWSWVNPETATVGGKQLRAAVFACRWLPEDAPAVRTLPSPE